MKRPQNSALLFLFFLFCGLEIHTQNKAFIKLCNGFMDGYDALGIPSTELNYKVNFAKIKNAKELEQQEIFFVGYFNKIILLDVKKLSEEQKLRFTQLKYEITMNLRRIELEKKWDAEGRIIPQNGLHSLHDYRQWYSYYIKHFTSVNITPEQVFEMGESEVKRIQQEIKTIQNKLGYIDNEAFYKHLQNDTFYLKDKKQVLTAYAAIDKIVRNNLNKLFPKYDVPEVGVMEWPNASANTPTGMYLDKENNPYGKDIFQFNFYQQRHNKCAMEWLYMHEAMPGHHLQYVARRNIISKDSCALTNRFFYFGNTEGWACYVEDCGKEMGLYQNEYTYLGKWQWDLVRSARLVMEVGIHYYGWTYEQTMQYWKDNIKGQDEIADREITRITDWIGQVLCYKVGALTIKKMVEQQLERGASIIEAHKFLLMHSDFPLKVLEDISKN